MEVKHKTCGMKYETFLKAAVINCEWNLCAYSCQKMQIFLEHILLHTSDIAEKPNELGFSCIWRNCSFICDNREELSRHVFLHAFHSKIKGIGKVVADLNEFQCFFDEQTRNMLPEIPECFECMWHDCDLKFNSAQNFYWHTRAHAMAEPTEVPIHCRWRGCKSVYKISIRLQEHIRTHTQEKLFGCHHCGSMLLAMDKFKNHFCRQQEVDPAFQCSYCKKLYPTEVILKDHVRTHINQYKCPQCEMTFTRKLGMQTHIKYRHSNSKPFKCPECPARFKGRRDVFRHMNVHSADPSFFCPFQDCSFKCRSLDGYNTHIQKIHQSCHARSYLCHMCPTTATKGRELTKHLRKVHNYQWPAGHTRFSYIKDEEGFYRLQTTRYESLELAEQISKATRTDNSPESDTISEPELVIHV